MLLTILDVNGLAAVRSGNLYRIIPREGAPQTSVPTVVGPRGRPAPSPPTRSSPRSCRSSSSARTDAVTLLRPLRPAQGTLAAHRETNLLIITDSGGEHPPAARHRASWSTWRWRSNELQIIPLKHADAQELAQILTQLFASGRLRPGAGPALGVPAPAPLPAARAPGAPPRGPRPPCRRRAARRAGAADRARAPLELARSSTRASRRWRRSGG